MKVIKMSLLGMMLAFGCQRDPYASRYATTKPNAQSLVGTWAVQNGLAGDKHKKPIGLTLESDGSFTADKFPGEALICFGEEGDWYSGEGTWEIEKHQWFWIVRVNWKKVGDKKIDSGEMLHIVQNVPPYSLHAIIGDPDEGKVLVFLKQQ